MRDGQMTVFDEIVTTLTEVLRQYSRSQYELLPTSASAQPLGTVGARVGESVGRIVFHHDHCVGAAVAALGFPDGTAVVGDWVVGARVGPGAGVMSVSGSCGAGVPAGEVPGVGVAAGASVEPGLSVVGGFVGVFGQYGLSHPGLKYVVPPWPVLHGPREHLSA